MNETKLPLLIGIGSRIRKSPYFDSTIKYGVTGFTIYNRMYLPTAFSGPESEYNSLINDVTFGDFAAERQVEVSGPDAYNFIRYINPRNLSKCDIGDCKYIVLTDKNGGIINDACLLRLEPNKFWVSPGDGLSAALNFDDAISERALPNGDSKRNTDELAIGKFHTGSLFPIIHRHVYTPSLQVCVQRLCGLCDHLRLIHAKWD